MTALRRRVALATAGLLCAVGTAGCTSSAATGHGTTATSRTGTAPVTTAPSRSSSGAAAGGGTSTSASAGATDPNNVYIRPEPATLKAIPGVVFRPEPKHDHVDGVVRYDASPPVGGDHSAYWADCTGTIYTAPIADENAVHDLEHGAVWVTYRPGLPQADLARLTSLFSGTDYTLVSPYPGLKSPISLQSWDYQLFLDSASDPRLIAFVNAVRANPAVTPELGASCSQPTFKAHPSTPGHPLSAPAS
ncbi:MAG: DUF3105 domain-containing protein [Jatrophihabitans sp.]|uniref:DUF3105 domain-containing protein n=1 Tax=Jatrophihabitans sp. TaxID=1932789 RepID=UPI003F8236FC